MKRNQPLYALLTALTLLSGESAMAQSTRDVYIPTVERTYIRPVEDVERAFYRKQARIDVATGLRELAPAALNALTGYGFLPTNAAYALSLTAVDSTHSKICIEMRVSSESLWKAAGRLLETPGVSRADAQCNAISASPIAAKWPSKLYAIKVLDTEDAMARTIVPSSPAIAGIEKRVITLPAMTLLAPPGQWGTAATFTITNPAAIALPKQPPAPTLSIAKTSVRTGFRAEHNCTQVPAQQTCTVAVQYFGNAKQKSLVGNLRLDFNDGKFMTVGLLGKPGTGLPIVTQLLDTVGGILTPPTTPTTPTPPTTTTPTPTQPPTVESPKCWIVWFFWWPIQYCSK